MTDQDGYDKIKKTDGKQQRREHIGREAGVFSFALPPAEH